MTTEINAPRMATVNETAAIFGLPVYFVASAALIVCFAVIP